MTRRTTRQSQWQPPVRLDSPINGPYEDSSPSISLDGRTLYFVSGRPGGVGGDSDFWQATLTPIVDFNIDGTVDLADLTLLIENWGTDNTLYDIGPYAWGDGKVDVEDLKVFIAEWEKENSPARP